MSDVVIRERIAPIGGGPEGHATFDVIERAMAAAPSSACLMYRCACGLSCSARTTLNKHLDEVRRQRNVEAHEVDHE